MFSILLVINACCVLPCASPCNPCWAASYSRRICWRRRANSLPYLCSFTRHASFLSQENRTAHSSPRYSASQVKSPALKTEQQQRGLFDLLYDHIINDR